MDVVSRLVGLEGNVWFVVIIIWCVGSDHFWLGQKQQQANTRDMQTYIHVHIHIKMWNTGVNQ